MSTSNKYNPGEFGYWWTVTEGNEDIEGLDYEGDINVEKQGLTSLRGSPRVVHGSFYCDRNDLKNLKHGPDNVDVSFWCSKNKLTSLKHCPTVVGGSFWCDNNQLISLKHCPQKVISFYCNDNQLTDLTNAPHKVEGSFYCENNRIADPLSEIINKGLIAEDFQITRESKLTFAEVESEKRKRAINRQLGPFAITAPESKI